MKLLIVYGTTEGQTRIICNYLRDKAADDGHQVTIVDATGPDVNPGNQVKRFLDKLEKEMMKTQTKDFINK